MRITEKSWAQYLRHYAEPEINIASLLEDYSWRYTVVIPARLEGSPFLNTLQSLEAAAANVRLSSSVKKSLCIVVLNGSREDIEKNTALSDLIKGSCIDSGKEISPSSWLGGRAEIDILILDRFSRDRCFVAKEGVGLARKIGCDLALALISIGSVEADWIFTTDADAILPGDYFRSFENDHLSLETSKRVRASAMLYPFWHQIDDDPESNSDSAINQAVELYEISLRYYVLGLEHARSPYAFQSVGSTLVIHADAYTKVRGFSKLEAGEDFYILNKLKKINPIGNILSGPVLLSGRLSTRTPFGTGRAVAKIKRLLEQNGTFSMYNPLCFEALRNWLQTVESGIRMGLNKNLADIRRQLCVSEPWSGPMLHVLENKMHAFQELQQISMRCNTPSTRLRRFHTWFDSFRTLKFIHHLRDGGLEDVAWSEALRTSSFIPQFPLLSDALSEFESRGAQGFKAQTALLAWRRRLGP